MITRVSVQVIATVIAAVVSAGIAHADRQSYLDAIGPVPFSESMVMAYGSYVCSSLHNGMTVQDVDAGLNYLRVAKPDITAIAQRELCPDTLE